MNQCVIVPLWSDHEDNGETLGIGGRKGGIRGEDSIIDPVSTCKNKIDLSMTKYIIDYITSGHKQTEACKKWDLYRASVGNI